jgi:hypothetical protein
MACDSTSSGLRALAGCCDNATPTCSAYVPEVKAVTAVNLKMGLRFRESELDIADLKLSTPCTYLLQHMYYHQLVHKVKTKYVKKTSKSPDMFRCTSTPSSGEHITTLKNTHGHLLKLLQHHLMT